MRKSKKPQNGKTNIQRIQGWIFVLILLLSPSFLGKQFILPTSYVRGVLVNYLIPTIYLTDILLAGLLLSWLIGRLKSFGPKAFKARFWGKNFRSVLHPYPLSLLFFFLAFLSSSFWAQDKLVAFSFSLRLGLYLFFAFFVSQKLREGQIKFLGIPVLLSCLLALGQFFLQRHLFGYLFFGEPDLSFTALSVVKINFFGKELTAPYATFPHPNVLGGFLAVVLPLFLLFSLRRRRGILAALGIPVLFLTFSFSAWSAFILGAFLRAGQRLRRTVPLLALALGFFLLAGFLIQAEHEPLSIKRRGELSGISLRMFWENPLGVGAGNFPRLVPEYGIVSGTAPFYQPVHNIYLLVLAETGVLGVLAFGFLLKLAYRRWRQRPSLFWIFFAQVLFLGFFDHYLLTLPQGLFLFSLTLGLLFRENKT